MLTKTFCDKYKNSLVNENTKMPKSKTTISTLVKFMEGYQQHLEMKVESKRCHNIYLLKGNIQGAAEVTPFLLFKLFSFCLICSLRFRNIPFLYRSFLIYDCLF